MNIQFNARFVSDFRSSLVSKILGQAFREKEALGGRALLNVSPCKQLNFLVMKALFTKWQEEAKQLESPYFNYRHPEVRKALTQFMNALSQHIMVKPDDLRSLLENAVDECLLLVTNPAGFIKAEFAVKRGTQYAEKQTKSLMKYIKVLTDEFHHFFTAHAKGSYEDLFENAKRYFADVPLTEAQQEVFSQLSTVSEISLRLLVGEEDTHTGLASEEKANPSETGHEPIVRERQETTDTHPESLTIPDNLLSTITINRQYVFVQELFKGDVNEFRQAMIDLESSQSFDDAVEYLVSNHARKFDWDMNSDEVKELLKVVFRRFR